MRASSTAPTTNSQADGPSADEVPEGRPGKSHHHFIRLRAVVIAVMTISFVFDVGPADPSVKTTDTSATALAGG
jgi:hypothetical protein